MAHSVAGRSSADIRRTLVVQGPLAFRMQRLAAARRNEIGVQILTLPLLAARLAGGFCRPASAQDLDAAIRSALAEGGFQQLEAMRNLPGMTRAVGWTLAKIWNSDIALEEMPALNARLRDVALIEARVRAALPAGALAAKDLRNRALARIDHAPKVLGAVTFERATSLDAIWHPLVAALARLVDVAWSHAAVAPLLKLPGRVIVSPPEQSATPQVVSCATPRAEVVEALRWARELLATGRALPGDLAICAASTDVWDEHFLTLAKEAELPVHFSHGVPALSTFQGQSCAALADALLNGLSQDRVRRLVNHVRRTAARLSQLSDDWYAGLPRGASLTTVEHWRRAAARSSLAGREDRDLILLLSLIEDLADGPRAAEALGNQLLGPAERALWSEALRRAPAEALELSLQDLRVADGLDPGSSIVWCPASHLAGAPRRWARILGMNARSWPRRARDDAILPNDLLAQRTLDPDNLMARDRRTFAAIRSAATGGCVLSRARRTVQGTLVAPSALIDPHLRIQRLDSARTPHHAFSESDRLLARPQEAGGVPSIASAIACWAHWQSASATAHDGRFRAQHPVVLRTIGDVQSSTSLRLMLRDPLAFVWRYALGWHATLEDEAPLSLSPRVFGELVHDILKRAVDRLEPNPGFARAARHEIENALDEAVATIARQWPLDQAVPPPLLWQFTLEDARALALRALTLDEGFQSETRSWTEVPFGAVADVPTSDLPWNPRTEVHLPGTNIRVRGSIDRLDFNGARQAVRLSDYKTGVEPPKAGQIVLNGGSELQRVIYAVAARQLLPEVRHIVARLVFLGGDEPHAYAIRDVDGAISNAANLINVAVGLLESGTSLPGPDARERWNEFRLALPAASATYFQTKRRALAQLAGDLSRVWSAR